MKNSNFFDIIIENQWYILIVPENNNKLKDWIYLGIFEFFC